MQKPIHCTQCGLKLTDPVSVAREIGPECAASAARQFDALSSLVTAMATGYFDNVADRLLREKAIIEKKITEAKTEANWIKVKNLTKKLAQVKSWLVGRENLRIEKASKRQYDPRAWQSNEEVRSTANI